MMMKLGSVWPTVAIQMLSWPPSEAEPASSTPAGGLSR